MCQTFTPNGRRVASAQGRVAKWDGASATIMFAFCTCGQTFGMHSPEARNAFLTTRGQSVARHDADACGCQGCNPYDRSP